MDREICHIFVSAARRELLAGSLEKNFYSILADESSDIAKKEQLSFSVRTCSNDYEVFEDFLGVFECMDGVSNDSLLHYIRYSPENITRWPKSIEEGGELCSLEA